MKIKESLYTRSFFVLTALLLTAIPSMSIFTHEAKAVGTQISGTIWSDTNSNAVQDSGENVLANVRVNLSEPEVGIIATTTTNSNGIYTFPDLDSFYFTVTVDTSTIANLSAQTYDLDGLATPNEADVNFSFESQGVNEQVNNAHFGYHINTSSISGTVWSDANSSGVQDSGELGISNATVKLLNSANTVLSTTTTNASGAYTFAGLEGSNLTVTVDTSTITNISSQTYDADGVATANKATFALPSATQISNANFGYLIVVPTSSISGTVWSDANSNGVQDTGETGISNTTVQLFTGDSTIFTTATTNSNGAYSFANLSGLSFRVQVDTSTIANLTNQTYDLDGLSSANKITFTLQSASQITNGNFGYLITVPAPVEPVISQPTPVADLAITMEVDPSEVEVRDTITYTITITNIGDAVAVGVVLFDTLPEEIENATYRIGSSGTFNQWTGELSLDTVDPGESITVTIKGTTKESVSTASILAIFAVITDTVQNTASVSTTTAESITNNNTASASFELVQEEEEKTQEPVQTDTESDEAVEKTITQEPTVETIESPQTEKSAPLPNTGTNSIPMIIIFIAYIGVGSAYLINIRKHKVR